MYDFTTERSFGLQATLCLAYFWHVIHKCLYDQALEDVRPTGAGIKCLYCRPTFSCVFLGTIKCSVVISSALYLIRLNHDLINGEKPRDTFVSPRKLWLAHVTYMYGCVPRAFGSGKIFGAKGCVQCDSPFVYHKSNIRFNIFNPLMIMSSSRNCRMDLWYFWQ